MPTMRAVSEGIRLVAAAGELWWGRLPQLVLVFALMAGGGGSLAATALVGCAYGFFVVMGLVELVWGMPALRAEADWVRAGLGNRPGECLSDAAGRHG
jgi:hypothetical protein